MNRDETIIAYVDDELPQAERDSFEALMAADEALAARVAGELALRDRISGAFAPVVDEPVPDDLRALVERDRAPGVIEFAPRPRLQVRPLPAWAPIAASLVVGVLVGLGGLRLLQPASALQPTGDGIVARGHLAAALNDQLASEPQTDGPVRVGLTLRDRQGRYCRTFTSSLAGGLGGLACRDRDAWRIEVATRMAPVARTEMRTAASETPPAVLAAVDELIAGDPLGAQAEAAARDAGWR